MTLKFRVLLIFSIVFTLSHTLFAQSQPLFSVTSFQDIGAQQVMATGDFNGDGQPDLATISANSASSTLTILLEQDNATPPIAKTTSLGIGVTRLVAVDMNKDKELDLVAVCTSSGSTGIAVLLGNGDGTFQAPVFYPITGVQNLTATDLNGDGYPDIAAISSSNLFVLLNEGLVGPGTLSAPASYLDAIGPSPSGPLNIGSGDFNGDGKQDIIIGGDLIAVLFGNGDGTLQAQQSVSPGTSGNCFATVDVNHDGITDIVYIAPDPTDPTSLYVSVYLGHSNGTFSSYESVGLDLSSSYPIALVPAGTSNNGNDVLFAAVSDKTMILDASGILAQSISYAVNGTPFPVLNSSGKTDLVFDLTGTSAGSTDNKILRVRGNGDGTFTGASNSFDAGPFGFVAADFNNDGLTDIVTVNSTNSMITGLGRGNGTFSISSSFPNAPGKLLVAADFDHDGNQDIAAILAFSGQDSLLYFYKGLGDGSFRVPDGASYVNLHVPGAVSAIAGDFNGDGTADIIVSYSNSTSQGSFSCQARAMAPSERRCRSLPNPFPYQLPRLSCSPPT